VDGGKTGYVAESGHNLLASAVRGGRRVLVVVTGAETAAAAADRCGGYFERAYGS
jgi:D-alanyl-D-alanine carboxypeptidase